MSFFKNVQQYLVEIAIISLLLLCLSVSAITLHIVTQYEEPQNVKTQRVISLQDVIVSPVFTENGSVYLISRNDSLTIKYKIDAEVAYAIYVEKAKQLQDNYKENTK